MGVLWLVERREKSTQLKDSFYEKAEGRFNVLSKKYGVVINHSDTIFSISPLYPFEILTDYRRLREEIVQNIRVRGWGDITFPKNLDRTQYKPIQNGVYSLQVIDGGKGSVPYEELNHYGFFYYRDDFGRTDKREDGTSVQFSYLKSILVRLDLFLLSMSKFYVELGY